MSSYLDIGFDRNFKKAPQVSDVNPYDYRGFYQEEEYASSGQIQQMTYTDAQSTFQQGIPGNNIQGGIIQSSNGNLQIDLDQGSLSYNDGVSNLISIGGASNNVIISNTDSSTLLSTGSSSESTNQTS